ncbi:MAG: NUDIX domain-containing protein, partial [Pseudomonadota bacterium]|nr:NUDIX domain-containing protein [Pseudomonadota bacterium]
KGVVDAGESLDAAASRELAEEAGFAANHTQVVKRLTLAPGHMGFAINVVFAKDLYPKRLQGDEPEPPELVTWPIQRLDELLTSDEFCEARAIAALALCRPLFVER